MDKIKTLKIGLCIHSIMVALFSALIIWDLYNIYPGGFRSLALSDWILLICWLLIILIEALLIYLFKKQ